MARIVLGHNQVMTLNGAAIQGMRDFDLDLSGKEFDITNWQHQWTSSIVLCASATVKLLIYWEENYRTFQNLFNKHPATNQLVRLAVAGLFSGQFSVSNVQVKSPINGNVAWEVTLKSMVYGT
jgi:predicted secreted protein